MPTMGFFSREPRSPRRIWSEWMKADDDGDVETAGRLAEEMVRATPDSFRAWFQAGLFSKARGDWRIAVERNQKAARLYGQREALEYGVNPAAWNLGIAATALGDWATARKAWIDYGIDAVAPGEEPIDDDFGLVPIRLNPDNPSLPHQRPVAAGETEVVWCWRRSPAHAVIASVPLPESGHRFRDVLLHDGEPKGERKLNGHSVPVFDQLDRLQDSEMPTWQAVVVGADASDVAALEDEFGPRGLGVDDWSGIRLMCRTCSHGSPDDSTHRHDSPDPASRTLGLAGAESELRTALDAWTANRPQIEVAELTFLW